MTRALATILLVVGCCARAHAEATPLQDGERVALDGVWRYHLGDTTVPAQAIDPAWKEMAVPSNWYAQGVDYAGVVIFAREVELQKRAGRHALELEGVDYAADVYWDGQRVGSHRGYFAGFRVELPHAQPGRHVLAIRVESATEAPSAWSLRKTMIKGVLAHHDTRPGNAWSVHGQDANTGGIWGHVWLRRVSHAFVDQVRVTTEEASATSARLSISARVDRAGPASVRFRILDRDQRAVVRGAARLQDGVLSAEATVPSPKRWWPAQLGDPYLYTLVLELSAGKAAVDRTSVRFGIRTVQRDTTGRLLINGEPVFLRGTNYIATQYFASFPSETLARDLDLMRSANINAVRVHAHVTMPAFYDMADERGLLVWQDFPLQWGYDDSDAFASEAARQAREMIAQLYNHPSVVFWSGMNEAPFSSDWMVWKYPDYDPDQNRTLERVMRATLAEDDPSRPSEGNAHPSAHAWAGWYSGSYRDFAKPTAHTVLTEFGAQAVPQLPTLRTFLSKQELWPIEGANLARWEYHGFQLRELRDIAKVDPGKSVRELVGNTQRYQARLLQFAAEHLRRQKWQPVTGIFQFMFVEHWPSTNWGMVDYLRKPKLGYAALARAYQPLLPMLWREGKQQRLRVVLINDRTSALAGATLSVTARPGSTPPRVIPAAVAANDVARLVDVVPLPAANQTLELELVAADGSVVSRNAYEPGYFAP